ncbi:hypothetical protein BS333_21145 (plasmid) [Vibrio azureus]|uniref:Lipoprotein n=1 Tax=Vibrio azureus NBRC 104587 TaxID=1219077 RepID=U3ADR2_9VIBR|nr:hypothetical protein [Vibrio azureus]AUI88883.1 hypothetical protein BS333_21145 [Vibrio azureus]GAD78061.1 hypothetical protein VAZ01S_118_00040 [Vibrio azureus NBRC 104587]
MRTLVLLFSILLVGCQSTTGNSSFAPNITNIGLGKLAVMSPNNTYVEDLLVEDLNNNKVSAVSGRNIAAFANDLEELKSLLKKNDVSHLLLVNSQVGQEDIRYTGNINNSQANVTSWGSGFASASSNSISTPIYSSSNSAAAKGQLFTVDGELVWVADLVLEASGSLYTGKRAMASGIAEGFIEEMTKSKLIVK